MTKEEIYDAQIDPLMRQVIEICKASGIAMVSSFYTPINGRPLMAITSIIPDGDDLNGPGHVDAARAVGAVT